MSSAFIRDQTPGSISLLSFVSDGVVFPDPLLLKDCGFDPFCLSVEGLTEQWLGASCTQESLWDSVAAVSGIIENHNTHLAPGFTLNDLVLASANVAVLWGLLGTGGLNSVYQMSFSSGTTFPRVAQEPLGPHSAPGDSPFPPERCQVSSCRVAVTSPLFTVLMEFKPSPFSFLHF